MTGSHMYARTYVQDILCPFLQEMDHQEATFQADEKQRLTHMTTEAISTRQTINNIYTFATGLITATYTAIGVSIILPITGVVIWVAGTAGIAATIRACGNADKDGVFWAERQKRLLIKKYDIDVRIQQIKTSASSSAEIQQLEKASRGFHSKISRIHELVLTTTNKYCYNGLTEKLETLIIFLPRDQWRD